VLAAGVDSAITLQVVPPSQHASPAISAPNSPRAVALAQEPTGSNHVSEVPANGDNEAKQPPPDALASDLSPSVMQRMNSGSSNPLSSSLNPWVASYPSLASKRVFLLRHSESLWNVNGSHRVRGLIDTTLTNTGVKQAKQLQGLLQRTGALQRLGIRLVAVSPLTRTLQTYMLAVRWYLDLFPSSAASGAAGTAGTATPPGQSTPSSSSQPSSSAAGSSCVRVCVNADLAEQLLSTGTIGRSPDQLAKDFCDGSLDFSALPPVWWYAPSKDELLTEEPPSASAAATAASAALPLANTKIFLKKEPVARLRARIHRFLRWLEMQPEESILVVGHGTYFREMVDEGRVYPDVFKSNLCVWRM